MSIKHRPGSVTESLDTCSCLTRANKNTKSHNIKTANTSNHCPQEGAIVPSPRITETCGRECFLDRSRSVWSCAGVTFTTPTEFNISDQNKQEQLSDSLCLILVRRWFMDEGWWDWTVVTVLELPVPNSMSTSGSVMMGISVLVKGCRHCFPWTVWNKEDKQKLLFLPVRVTVALFMLVLDTFIWEYAS